MNAMSDFPEATGGMPKRGPMERVCKLPNGYSLYRQTDEVGGYDYFTDEVAGLHIWSTSLTDKSTLMAAMAEEDRRFRDAMRAGGQEAMVLVEAESNRNTVKILREAAAKIRKLSPKPLWARILTRLFKESIAAAYVLGLLGILLGFTRS